MAKRDLVAYLGVFPAGAGVIPRTITGSANNSSVSRRRGGDPTTCLKQLKKYRCFPQARG